MVKDLGDTVKDLGDGSLAVTLHSINLMRVNSWLSSSMYLLSVNVIINGATIHT